MGNSVAAKAGLLPTTRGFAGNIILGDVIVAVDDKPVSICSFRSFFREFMAVVLFFRYQKDGI